jgi:hypothetical protein
VLCRCALIDCGGGACVAAAAAAAAAATSLVTPYPMATPRLRDYQARIATLSP